jgi:hypothetical protein
MSSSSWRNRRKKDSSQGKQVLPQGNGVKEPVIRASTWVLVALVGALGGAITDVVQPIFASTLNALIERGDPVAASPIVEPAYEGVWLPDAEHLSAQHRNDLSAMDSEAQIATLESRGGIVLGNRELKVILTGQREQGVSVIDMRPVSECSGYTPGSVIITSGGPRGTEPNLQMIMEVDRPSQDPILYDPDDTSGVEKSAFDGSSINLAKDEYRAVNLQLRSNLACSVNIEIKTMEDQKIRTQMLFDEDEEITVAGDAWKQNEDLVQEAYVGGSICNPYRTVPSISDDVVDFLITRGCPDDELG